MMRRVGAVLFSITDKQKFIDFFFRNVRTQLEKF